MCGGPSSVSSLDQFTEVFAQLKRACDENRLAHAYVVAGSPSGAGLALAQSLLKLLFCEGAEKPCGQCANCHRVERRQHPDIYWLEPEKKSRIIGVDQIRELNTSLSQTAFSGGWKAGVILASDRLREEAANAFLKTLEEPPGRTLLLLVTDQAQAMLPTIISRCQRVVLEEPPAQPAWMGDLLAILERAGDAGGLDDLMLAGRIKALLDRIKDGIQESENGAGEESAGASDEEASKDVLKARVQAKLIKERTELLKALQHWQRDLLACRCGAGDDVLYFRSHAQTLRRQSRSLDMPQLLSRVRGVDRVAQLLEVNLPDLVAFETYLLGSSRGGAAR